MTLGQVASIAPAPTIGAALRWLRSTPTLVFSAVLTICTGLCATGLTGCGPAVMSYTHLAFDPKEGLEVLERSTNSLDSQGKELRNPKIGLPLKLRLARPNYTLLFDTPLSSIPLVFMSARDAGGVILKISGSNVKHVYPGSASELDGFEYSFYVKEADGVALSITISGPDDKVLGSETLPYKIVPRGYREVAESS